MPSAALTKLASTLIAVTALLFTATSAFADVATFATFSSVSSIRNIRLVNSGTGPDRNSDLQLYTTSTATASTPGSTRVYFSFLQDGLSTFVTNVVADFTLDATVAPNTPALVAGNVLVQQTVSGTMKFISTTPITLGAPYFGSTTIAAGANLLTVTFDSTISGGKNGSTSSLSGSTNGGNVVSFTSDFLDFSTIDNADLAASFSALSNTLKIDTNESLSSFRATAGGQFSSDPAPTVIGYVPESASWIMMIIGFAMVGVPLRRRPQPVVRAA
jgi:hypothetical protein